MRLGQTALIPLSVAEIRRLISLVLCPHRLTPQHHLHWSWWRRLSQTRARRSHYKRRGHNLQL
ncbi:hypothetical protein ACFYXM_37130 [Streptomyces sp. NPDC002476]|uniref:hypothetical protein n=1 Tax=Streptomyces sp. NPDC002476 TaxID=3364648 RepID=UPI00368F82AC